MVRVELSYNPYLLETEVLFNGNPPRINSQIEKYQGKKLQTWIEKVPSIFYDEMNGYDFELDFSGTTLDYEELTKSFEQAGVGKDRVKLFHKEEIKGRSEKVRGIDSLLEWLKKTPNHRFDQKAFQERNQELFEGAYPFVVIGGKVGNEHLFDDIETSIDNVDSSNELRKTDLRNIPILFYLDRKSVGSLQYNLRELLKRPDIDQNQLFFLISPVLGEKVERVIRDLGVNAPQIVSSADDSVIYRYMELFPVSEYIHDAISAFREETVSIGSILEKEYQQSEITNKDIHEKINSLEDAIARLKTAENTISAKTAPDFPSELITAKETMISAINQWKIKKTKMTRFEEAKALSLEFDAYIKQLFHRYWQDALQACFLGSGEILNRCDGWYKNAHYQEYFTTTGVVRPHISEHHIPSIASDLMKIKDEQYVIPKEDFFGKLFKTTHDEDEFLPVLETTYYYEKWRSYAVEVVESVAEKVSQEVFTVLCSFSLKVSEMYIEHIKSQINELSAEKEKVSSQLSEGELLLQIDRDWHTSFCDKLYEIERA